MSQYVRDIYLKKIKVLEDRIAELKSEPYKKLSFHFGGSIEQCEQRIEEHRRRLEYISTKDFEENAEQLSYTRQKIFNIREKFDRRVTRTRYQLIDFFSRPRSKFMINLLTPRPGEPAATEQSDLRHLMAIADDFSQRPEKWWEPAANRVTNFVKKIVRCPCEDKVL